MRFVINTLQSAIPFLLLIAGIRPHLKISCYFEKVLCIFKAAEFYIERPL